MADFKPSAYADPQPYDDPDLERSMIAGRIEAAHKIAKICEEGGDTAGAARWRRNADRLLERYLAADDLAALAAGDDPRETTHDR
jgi:predicted secreted protein